MKISIWHPKKEWIEVSPETVVYTMRLQDEMTPNLLCDMCWTNKEEVTSHFWNKSFNGKLKFITMSFKDYMKKHFEEIHGMNPFWDIGRLEFLEKYNNKWNLVK